MSDSVALVVLDTLRKDAFDEYFGWLGGRSFERALSPSHWTTPVHGSIFAGAYPSETGVHAGNPMLDCPQPTLAEKLSRDGWTCRGFSANGNVAPSTDFDRGFDEFTAKGYHSTADVFDWQGFVADGADPRWRRYSLALWACLTGDCDTLPSLWHGVRIKYDDVRYGGPPNLTATDIHSYVRKTDYGNREFLFLNLMEAHDSYAPPPAYRTVDPPNVNSISALAEVLDPKGEIDAGRYQQAYDDSVRYLSEKYRAIHEDLMKVFDYIIITSDHGEAFGDDGIYGHVPSLAPEIVHVPLTITGHNVSPGQSLVPVNLLDVHRTITDIAGVEAPLRGVNLLDGDGRPTLTEAHGVSDWQREALRGRGVSSERLSVVEELRRGIGSEDYYAYESLFDGWVSTGYDGDKSREELNRLVADLSERDGDDAGVPEEVRAHLKDMGYV